MAEDEGFYAGKSLSLLTVCSITIGTRFADGAFQLLAKGWKRRLDCLAQGSTCLLAVLHALLSILVRVFLRFLTNC
jgi:hypothetical protein